MMVDMRVGVNELYRREKKTRQENSRNARELKIRVNLTFYDFSLFFNGIFFYLHST